MTATSGRPVVLITGAASGIGAATARAFADRDWIVYATDIEAQFPAAVVADCRCLELDVTDTDQSHAVVDQILGETGRIDVLVNNAGFASSGPVEDVAVEDARQQFDVLVHGTHSMIQAVLPTMRDRHQGRLIMVSSVLGVAASPGLGTYGAAKAAVESLTDSLRMELSDIPGVSVSLVEPAWVDTAFSANAVDRLPTTDRTPVYSGIYETVEKGWVVDGGPLATTPEAVASTVFAAATVDSPNPRYPVGTVSRLVMASRLLPARFRDQLTVSSNRFSITARRLWECVSRYLRLCVGR
jgi:NAD(P)-dependent dehydrogenase (short-subunit alcohol dehydrogenase family)